MKKLLHLLLVLLLISSTSKIGYSQCSSGEEEVTIKLHTDTWGSEITWTLSDPSGTLLSGGPYDDGSEIEDVQSVCVTEGTELTFSIHDSQNDGICIPSGEAKYQIIAYDFIFAENCDYGSGETIVFTLESPPDIDAKLLNVNISDYISQEYSLKGTLFNNGLNDLTSIDLSWQIDNGTINTETISGFAISSNETVVIEHPTEIQFEDSLITENINIWISNPNGLIDENMTNDTIKKTVKVLDSLENRRVLIEHFTNASCGPCASQNPTLNALLEEGNNPDIIAHIAYHMSWPGYDPMYDFNESNGEGDMRRSYYGVTGVPDAVLGGDNYQGGPANITQTMVDEEYAIPSLIRITTEQEIIGDTIYLDAEFIALIDLPSTNMKAHIALTELKEYESAPGTNGEKKFENVMRTMITEEDGYSIGPLDAYDKVKVSFKKKIDTYEIDDPKVLVFIQDNDDKDILNAYLNEEDFGPLGVKLNIEDGLENYITAEKIIVYFNDPVQNIDNSEITDPSSLIVFKEDNSSGVDVPFTAIINEDKTEIEVTLDHWLETDKTYYISLQPLENENEFSYPEKHYTFTMIAYPSTKINTNPRNADTYVSRDDDLVIIFDMPIRLINDESVTDPTSLISLRKTDENGEDVPFTAVIDTSFTKITIDPEKALDANQFYNLGIIGNIVENKYNVAVSDTSITFKTGTVSGIDNNMVTNNINIYPNPTKQNLNIDLKIRERSNVQIKIFNETGQLVKISDQGLLSNGDHKILLDLTELNNGIYFINVLYNNKNVVRKIQVLK